MMSSIRFSIAGAAFSVLLLTGAAGAAPGTEADIAVQKMALAAAPMSAAALEHLYGGRTWRWSDGGGYFSTKKHRFTAVTRKGTARSFATGRWFATDGGKLCMKAYWSNAGGGSGAITCFLHRERDGVIYQKPNLGGQWYVFRHNPVQKDDEARKLLRGDRIRQGR
ncbi:DUF995 domain-containing protein [Brucella sp. 10RB9215]|uniref:DUF995 domain-containing protein n=1 Tax=Brucella sp. 10RB9215 TaxID=1149953 RepID=UPI0010FE9949|nr:DUF995 domain-containing protein [Brucella sp. 10RB9215]